MQVWRKFLYLINSSCKSVSQALLGWLPSIGSVINASTAFTLTETIGWTIANNFASKKREAEAEAAQGAESMERETVLVKPVNTVWNIVFRCCCDNRRNHSIYT